MEQRLSYEGYKLVFQDDFDAPELNRADWNVELHEPGWVNQEWQRYVDSPENIFLKDGKLVIRPVKTIAEDGGASYTSGRVCTRGKHEFTYGIFEARLKVPAGKGYLPAFWLLADEDIFEPWPFCGEIDIMEVMGDKTNLNHGTIHYGLPHEQNQGIYTLKNGDFSKEYHTFALKWEPGRLSWYVDGELFHVAQKWFCAREGEARQPFPHPFDQYEFTKVVASDADGVQRGSTWQACPCLMVYRRDIARDVFGTDDPDEIGAIMGDWNKAKEAAAKLKGKGYYTFSSYADTFRSYGNSISAPWVTVNGSDVTLTVDPQIMKWISDSKEWLDAGYLDKNIKGQWNDDWNKGMGSKSKVFSYLFPAWGIDFVLKPNWDGADGSWGVTTGPQSFNWGGSFVHGCVGTDNPEHVKEIILAVTGNKDNLMNITKTYLDFTNTKSGMKEIAEDESFGADFLGGENPFKYFAPAAEGIKMTTLSAYDQGFVELIQNTFGDYLQGQIDFDRAKVNFESAIKERYPDITQVVWPE